MYITQLIPMASNYYITFTSYIHDVYSIQEFFIFIYIIQQVKKMTTHCNITLMVHVDKV